jgi:hypothetical protein
MKIVIEKTEVIDTKIKVSYVVLGVNDTQLFGGETYVRSEQECNSTLQNILKDRIKVEEEAKKINVGEWQAPIPTPPTPPSEPTPEELKSRDILNKEQVLRQAVLDAEERLKIQNLAAQDPIVAQKLQELEEAKTETVTTRR